MDKRNYSNGLDLPLGLSMALGQSPMAMNYFTNLSSQQKSLIIGATHQVHSKGEMQQLVSNMENGTALTESAQFPTDLSSKHNI